MAYHIGLDHLHLRPTERAGHVVYSLHEPLRTRIFQETGRSLEDAWECDLIWHTNDGPAAWGDVGRVTNMGHAEFLADGADRREPDACPFSTVEEACAFDAVKEYGLIDRDALAAFYQAVYRRGREDFPHQVYTGGYYKTLISGAIEIFGWDMLLQLAADQDAFETVLESVFQVTLHHARAWAATEIEAFIIHDDMVWTQGPFMDPAFYRRAIFPRYAMLARLLQEAGKKVLYCSDGNWTVFMDDLAETGMDGFIFEPMVPWSSMVERFGGTHVLIGSALDCRTLIFSGRAQIRAEIDATLEAMRGRPGFFFAVGNHVPPNAPVDNALFYQAYLFERLKR